MARQVHDIRDMIPRTDQTNPAKFPEYEFVEYPKMMTMMADKKYVDDWMERYAKIDDRTGKQVWPGGRPRVGAPVPILDVNGIGCVVHDEDEEAAFRAEHPEALSESAVVDPQKDALERRNAELEAEIAALKVGGKPPGASAQADTNLTVAAAVKPSTKKKSGKANLPKDLK